MTVQESASALRGQQPILAVVDFDDYLGEPRCPLCAMTLDEAGTPTVGAEAIDAGDDLPVFGWRCNCRRTGVNVLATIEHAPDDFVSVDVTVDGQTVSVGVPAPALEEVEHVA